MDDFPLFVLGIVALPTEAVPLHVFEDRYRAMIARCLDDGSEFGIVWADERGERATGCACAIDEVIRRHDDGRLEIITRGTRPFAIVERHDQLRWPAATVEFLDDLAEEPDLDAAQRARDTYAELVREATDEEPVAAELAALGAYGMAATVELTAQSKQELLELRSENARLARVAEMIADAMRRFAFIARAAQSARGNGRVHHD